MRKDLERLVAKEALHELNVRYAHAVDRLDSELMATLWHPDATVDVGVFEGAAGDYAAMIVQPNPAMPRSFHALTNEWYQVDTTAGSARGEVYVTAAISNVGEGGERSERLVGGRYIDHYERLAGEWLFLSRAYVLDWSKGFDSAAVWSDEFMALFKHNGTTGVGDLSAALFK
jgi:hypothetical protein